MMAKISERCSLEDIQVEHIKAAEALATAKVFSDQMLRELLVAHAAIERAWNIITRLHPQGENHDTDE